MIQLAQHQILSETYSSNEYTLIAPLSGNIRTGINQLKRRLEKKVGLYPGAQGQPHIKICSFLANNIWHNEIQDQLRAAILDFRGSETLELKRINFNGHKHTIDIQIGGNQRITQIQQRIRQRLKVRMNIKKTFKTPSSLLINVGHDMSSHQYVRGINSFKNLNYKAEFELTSLLLLQKKSGGNYRFIKEFKL